MQILVKEELAFNESERNLNKVRKLIKSNKQLARSELMRKSNLSAKVINAIVDTLEEREEIEIDKVERSDRPGKPRTVYKWLS